jgi:hypothetical protein
MESYGVGYYLMCGPMCHDYQLIGVADDRNFYVIFSIIISSKMTKTDHNTKENLQNPRKVSRQSQECKKTRKNPKYEEKCCSSCHDGFHRATMEATCSPRQQQKKI